MQTAFGTSPLGTSPPRTPAQYPRTAPWARRVDSTRPSGDAYERYFASQPYAGEAQLNDTLFHHYASTQGEWSRQASLNLEFVYGTHWTPEQVEVLLERQQHPLSINTTYQVVMQAVAMLTHNSPAFRATGRENSDRRIASVLSDLLTWIWQQSNGDLRFKKIAKDFYVKGRGVGYVWVDPNGDMGKGEVCLSDLDPQEVFPDPNSKDPLWDDASHIVVKRLFTRELIGQVWPHVDLTKAHAGSEYTVHGATENISTIGAQLFDDQIGDGYHERFPVVERFTKVKRAFHRITDPKHRDEEVLDDAQYQLRRQHPAFVVVRPTGREFTTDPADIVPLQALYRKTEAYGGVFHYVQTPPVVTPDGTLMPGEPQMRPGPAGPDAVPGSEVRLVPTSVGALIDAGWIRHVRFLEDRIKVVTTIGGQLLFEPQILPFRHYPIVPFQSNHERTPYPVSDVALVRDLQLAINKTQSLILAHAANTAGQKVFVPRNSVDREDVERRYSRSGAQVFEYDSPSLDGKGSNPIHAIAPPPYPAALYENLDRFIALIQHILGVPPLQGGQGEAPLTYHGTLAIDEFGLRRVKSKMDDLYAGLSRMGSLCLQAAQQVYTREKTVRIVQPNMPAREVTLNQITYDDFGNEIDRIHDVTVGRYDVIVAAGSTLPSNRWALLQTYLEMYQVGLVDDTAVLEHSELADADRILERNGIMARMQQALQSQAQTIEDLQGDLQTWQREAMHAKQRAELEKFKARLAEVGTEMRKASQVYEQTLRTELDKQKMAMTYAVKKAEARAATA